MTDEGRARERKRIAALIATGMRNLDEKTLAEGLTAFEEFVRADERESCAKAADVVAGAERSRGPNYTMLVCANISEAIRARGGKT